MPDKRSPDEENSPPKIKKSSQRLLKKASAGGEGNGDAFDENDEVEEPPQSQSMLADPVQSQSPMEKRSPEEDDSDLNSSHNSIGDEDDQSPENTTLDSNEGGLQEHSISRNFESLQGPSLNNVKINTCKKNIVPKEVGNGSGEGAGLQPDDPNAQGKK